MDEPSEPTELQLRHGLQELHRYAQALLHYVDATHGIEKQVSQKINRFEIEWEERLRLERDAELRGSAGVAHSLATAGYQMSPTAAAAFQEGVAQMHELTIIGKYDGLQRGLTKAVDEIGKGNAPDLDFTVPSRPNPDGPDPDKSNEAILAMARDMLSKLPDPELKREKPDNEMEF